MQGLVPVFSPGHPCVLKVHNAITYGTKSKDDLVQKNYKLALQVRFLSPLQARIVGKSCLGNIQTADLLSVLNNILYGYLFVIQECYVQNTAREYAKIYAAEAEPLEGFGEVPE